MVVDCNAVVPPGVVGASVDEDGVDVGGSVSKVSKLDGRHTVAWHTTLVPTSRSTSTRASELRDVGGASCTCNSSEGKADASDADAATARRWRPETS